MSIAKWKNFSKEEIQNIVKNSTSYSEVARQIGYNGSSGINTIKKVLIDYNIDTSHFKGHAWNKRDNELSWSTIRKQYFEMKPYQCEECGISDWNGKPISLTIHHKDGDHFNNDFSNLIILCPNCHSQTDNFCAKNRKKYSEITDAMFLDALLNTTSSNAACVAVGIPSNQSNYNRAKRLLEENKEAKGNLL